MIRRLPITLSLPALKMPRADDTAIRSAERNIPLAFCADWVCFVISAGLDRAGFLPADDAIAARKLRSRAISDFILSLPALETLRADYPGTWRSESNTSLAFQANWVCFVILAALDQPDFLPADHVIPGRKLGSRF